MSWSIRNYNTFIREARSEFGLNYDDAIDLYRQMRDELDRPLYGVDVGREYDLASGILSVWIEEESLDTPIAEIDSDFLEYADIDVADIDYLDEGVELELTVDLIYED